MALEPFKDHWPAQTVVAALKNSDVKVRRRAVFLWDAWAVRQSVQPLVGLLKDSSEVVRATAARALATLRDQRRGAADSLPHGP